MISQRRAKSAFIVILFLAATAATAQERGALTVTTDLVMDTVVKGRPFKITALLNYGSVPRDRVVVVRIECEDEPANGSLNDSKVKNACSDMSQAKCDGHLQAEFNAHFNKESFGQRWITIDAYAQTMDGKSVHFLDQYILKLTMLPVPTFKIQKIDAPRPPDTVRVGEPVPVRVTFDTASLLNDSRIKATIEAVSGGSGSWAWESGKLPLGGIITSEPIQVKLDKPGRWTFRVKAETTYAEAAPVQFGMEAVKEAKREVGPVTMAYPKPPGTVRVGEAVRFDVTMGYKSFPAGTVAAIVFGDSVTGKDLGEGWTTSRPIAGNGTYKFENLILHPDKKGDWKVDVMLRLPQLNPPHEYVNFWKDTVTLKVVAKTDGTKPGDPDVLEAAVTRIQQPSGSLKLNEMVPIIVSIRYDKLGTSGTILKAEIWNNGTHSRLGAVDSIPLLKNGTYTFPNIGLKAAPVGNIPLEARITSRQGRILAKKLFAIKVVN